MAGGSAAVPRPVRRRLFIAVEVADDAQDAIDTAIAPWRGALTSIRWSPRGNRHVTVRFLGGVASDDVAAVTAATAATAAAAAPFDLGLGALGVFPERGRARVWWVGLEDPTEALPQLVAAIEHLPPGSEPDTRPYHAHLTLGRADPPLAVPPGWRPTPVPPTRWRVERLVLFESHLRRPHAVYEPVASFGLGHVADPPADPR
jgi:2'-5' RNA ligase